jgi:hypothetical protein
MVTTPLFPLFSSFLSLSHSSLGRPAGRARWERRASAVSDAATTQEKGRWRLQRK